MPEVPDK
jgi:hypothetical protein